MSDLIKEIDGLSDAELAEAGILVLSGTMHITSESEARERLRETCIAFGGSPDKLQEFSDAVSDDYASHSLLLRTILRDMAEQQPDLVKPAIASVGRKQMVPDLSLVVALSVLTLLMTRKVSTDVDVTVEPDGKRRIKFKRQVAHAPPGSALAKLFDFIKTLKP